MIAGIFDNVQEDLEILKADRAMRILLSLWWRARLDNEGAVPMRSQLDPCSFPRPALPFMFVYERVGDRFRCRLAGTKMRDIFGADSTGQFLDQLAPAHFLPSRTALFQKCVESGMPVFYRAYLAPQGREWRSSLRLLLPAAIAGSREPTQIIGMLRIFDPAPRAASLAAGDGMISARPLDEADCRHLIL